MDGLICQSCGMPMQKGEDFGTNQDGTTNTEYCKCCYKNGKFLDKTLTLKKQVEKLVKLGVAELGMRENQARKMAMTTLPKLKRWKK
ncbi:transcriptional regulator [Candidatus Woesearchaeota archaeon]|nr:transcriptional regulator [Candidatus Woesearchaeota archaeon]